MEETNSTESKDSANAEHIENTDNIKETGNSRETNEEKLSYNLELDDMKDEDLEKVIGNTLFSERSVLSTLMKLTKYDNDLDDYDDFEIELCTLWNMTILKLYDVVKFLLEHNILDIFSVVIDSTEDRRLTKILVGIIGNMCTFPIARNELCMNSKAMDCLIQLTSCSDTQTLIQLMRVFYTALVFENSGDEIAWFRYYRDENFVQNFAFILSNSMNTNLLIGAFEALNSICVKFAVIEIMSITQSQHFRDTFVKTNLVTGVLEAFKTLNPIINRRKDFNNDITVPSDRTKKIWTLFLDINVILTQYEEHSRNCFHPILIDFLGCIAQILSSLSQPICLLPLTHNEQEIIENISEIFQAINDPFDEDCFLYIVQIWNLVDEERRNTNGEEWYESPKDINTEDLCTTMLECVTRIVRNASEEQLTNALKSQKSQAVLKLLNNTTSDELKSETEYCYNRIKSIVENSNSNNKTNSESS